MIGLPGASRQPRQPASPIDEPHVPRALAAPACVVLDVELDLLTLGQRVEHAARKRRMVNEDLAAVFGADKPKPAIPNDANDGTLSHCVSLQYRALTLRVSRESLTRLP